MMAVNPEGDRRPSNQPPPDASTPKACPSCGKRYPADALFCSLDGSPLTTSPGAIAAAAATDPYLGREILGHIEIRQLVGIGAMGRVYRAFQKGIDRDVAVKILHRELSANQTLVARFHREAKVASRLQHPNVVHVLLVGQLPDGAMYIVMEYLDGLSLQSALAAAGGAMPLPRALHVALLLCDAAGEAHAQGIVHRDLKPENVMIVKRADDPDFVKVLDFGIARLNWGEQSMATAAGLIFGTARYISPEGAQGEKVGPQGDVYSIATMVYQMLAGRAPFEAEQAVALLVQQIHDEPPQLKDIPRAAYLPDAIASVIMKNLSKKPDDRADNARSFGRELLEAAVTSGLSAQDILSRPAMLGGRIGASSSVVQMPSMQRTRQMQLEPDVAARLAAPKTSYLEPSQAVVDASASAAPSGRMPVHTEIAEAVQLPPGALTTKWSPPADFEAKLVPPPAPSQPSPLEMTMDDQQLSNRTMPLRAPARTALATAVPASPHASPPTSPPASVSGPVSVQAPMTPAAARDTAPPMSRTAPPTSTKPPSSVDRTMAGDETPERAARSGVRALVLVLVCFVVGAGGMAGIAYRAGLLGGHGHGAQVDSLIAKANDALAHQRWDSPPGDNVRDITDLGLARSPNDAQLLRIRSAACDAIIKSARAKQDAGETSEALRLAMLAAQLDPADDAAKKLVADLSAAPDSTAPPLDTSLPPLLASGHGPPATSGIAGAVRVAIDSSSAKPGAGQPVDFTAHLTGTTRPAKIEGARFFITGPGVSSSLDATDNGSGAYKTTFTFLEDGRFTVTFNARADGNAVASSRLVVVGTPKPLPLPPSSSGAGGTAPTGTTAPTTSGKWM
jgi:serine/threonine protein kinase